MITLFFQLDLELNATVALINELYPEQKQILEAYESIDKLQVHNLREDDFQEMSQIAFPRRLSQEYRSIIYLTKKLLGAIVISCDRLVRAFAGKLNPPTMRFLDSRSARLKPDNYNTKGYSNSKRNAKNQLYVPDC
jgi:hypothetical protein